VAGRNSRVGQAERFSGYAVLSVLAVCLAWLFWQQARFNPAVIVAQQAELEKAQGKSAAGQDQGRTAGFIPDIPGGQAQGPVESYGPDNLSDKIDGKAELYLSAGFKEMSCRAYGAGPGGQVHVEVYIYETSSPANAFAVYSGQRRPGSRAVSIGTEGYATSNALFFTHGPFYVEIVADRALDDLQGPLEDYGRTIQAGLPVEGQPQAKEPQLPQDGLSADSVRLNASDAFGLEGFNNVLTGEYNLPKGQATGFLAERDTPEAAASDAKRYLEFLTANGYQEISPDKPLEGVRVFKLDNSFEAVLVKGRTLAGAHDAESLESAMELAGRLQSGLGEK